MKTVTPLCSLLLLSATLLACQTRSLPAQAAADGPVVEAPALAPAGAPSPPGGGSAEPAAAPQGTPRPPVEPAPPPAEQDREEAPALDPGGSAEGPGLGVVTGAARLNVRKEPRAGSTAVLSVIGCGDVVGITSTAGEDKDWLRVQTERVKDGYVYGSYVVKLHPGSQRPLCESSPRRRALTKREKTEAVPLVIKESPVAAPDPPKAPIASAPEPEKKASAEAGLAALPLSPILLDLLGEHGKVTFPHSSPAHQAFKCFRCHHPVSSAGGSLKRLEQGEAANPAKKCRACHGAGGVVEARVNAKSAFHGTCIDCHRVAGRGKAPVSCNQCHGR